MNGVEEGKEFLEVEEGGNKDIMAEQDPMDEYVLSLNALTKSYNHNTIKVKGNYQNKKLIFFIENGSTHSLPLRKLLYQQWLWLIALL